MDMLGWKKRDREGWRVWMVSGLGAGCSDGCQHKAPWHQRKGLCFICPQQALPLLVQLSLRCVQCWKTPAIKLYKSEGLTTKAARHSYNEHLSAMQNVSRLCIHQMFIDLSFGHCTGLEIITSDLNSVQGTEIKYKTLLIQQQIFKGLHSRNIEDYETFSSVLELRNSLYLEQRAEYQK